MTPIPIAPSYVALNAMLSESCLARQSDRAGRHHETIGERLVADTGALDDLPAVPLEPCEKRAARVSSTALVRYRGNDYSTPTSYGFQEVLVKGFVEEVAILVSRDGDRPSRAILRPGRLRLRPAALSGADRDEAERSRPGCGVARLGSAGRLSTSSPPSPSSDGQSRQARVHSGAALDGGGAQGDRRRRGERRDPAGRHRL